MSSVAFQKMYGRLMKKSEPRIRRVYTSVDKYGKCVNCGRDDQGGDKCDRCQCHFDLRGFVHLPYFPITATPEIEENDDCHEEGWIEDKAPMFKKVINGWFRRPENSRLLE